jgi:hypothetical protein
MSQKGLATQHEAGCCDMQAGDCVNKIRFSISDETGVLRFTSFDIVDPPESCQGLEALREYLVGRPLAEVDVDHLRELLGGSDGECRQTALRVVKEYQRRFVFHR